MGKTRVDVRHSVPPGRARFLCDRSGPPEARHRLDYRRGGRLVGVDDHVQLAFAFQEARVMVTRDADFLRLHASGAPHAGIVYYPQTSRTVGQVIEDLILIYHVISADEMPDRVIFL